MSPNRRRRVLMRRFCETMPALARLVLLGATACASTGFAKANSAAFLV